ncbi:sulfatase [Crateriforma conspicua]|uniref:Choline-sulfatase n=1 Tax=Crateriforma conspicua TaxID=2527996 RepID=A0A5C5XSJ2_9PLAN|nr:sulfatase [Crateriforma conspicua]TWT65850.1 Choline-sulfatase [Crateriforma conspicua]
MQHTTSILFCGLHLIAFAAAGPAAHAAESEPIKNVLMIVSDDLKASVLGCYGDPQCETPNIDRLAARGMLFRRAYCQGTWCLPSRKSFMYSKYQGASQKTLGGFLQDHGYYSARVGKIFHMRVPGDIIDGTNGEDVEACWTERFNSPGREAHTPGDYACLNQNIFTDAPENRQSTRMPHRMFVTVQYDGSGDDQPDAKSAAKSIELLREHADQPFFLAVGFVRPHYPMVAPRDYFNQYSLSSIETPHVPENDLDDIPAAGLRGTRNGNNTIGQYPENQKRMWQGYYATVTFMDRQVGRILDELDRLGLANSTAIVFTSDHGYHLGEHTLWQKKNFHEEVTRVPLIVSVPGLASGETDAIVELVDIYPTVAELLGLAAPNDLDGVSLVSVLNDPTRSVRDSALSLDRIKSGWEFADRGDRWAYMRYVDGSEELYDMDSDPNQYRNLAKLPEYAAHLEASRRRMDEKIKRHELKR